MPLDAPPLRVPKSTPQRMLAGLATLLVCACGSSNPTPQSPESAPAKPARELVERQSADGQPTASESAEVQFFVQTLVADATLDDSEAWAGESLELIGALLAERGQLRSSSHVLARQGESATIDVDTSGDESAPIRVSRVVLTPHLGEAGDAYSGDLEHSGDLVRLVLEVSFNEGQAARTSLVLANGQQIFVPLENEQLLVVRGDIVRSRAELATIYERKSAAAHDAHHTR